VKRAEREAIMRQGVTLPETPRQRRDLAGLEADLEDHPGTGRALPIRLRNFRPSADSYLASLGGPLPYMIRLREIARRTEALETALGAAWYELALECDGQNVFARRWRELTAQWSFHEVNALIERHNRWYPVESRLPMDPARRDYALVNGEEYRREPLDAAWALERFPPSLGAATAFGLQSAKSL
jgi:hypothetical protein